MIEQFLVYVLGLCVSVFFATISAIYYRKYRKVLGHAAQLVIDKEIISEKLSIASSMASKDFSDGFIKFLSESREDAFVYIESVQLSIQRYLDAVNGGNGDEIATARMELFSHLPQNTDS
jgi:hypothetical protein